MPKSSKPRKGRKPPRRTMCDIHNQAYYNPIIHAVWAYSRSVPVLATSDAVPTETICQAIIVPVEAAIETFKRGDGGYGEFWVMLQMNYLFSHLLDNIIKHEMLSSDGLKAWVYREDLKEWLQHSVNVVAPTLDAIAKRKQRVGKYGFTGDEYNIITDHINRFRSVLSWCCIRNIYHTICHVSDELVKIERDVYKKRGWV